MAKHSSKKSKAKKLPNLAPSVKCRTSDVPKIPPSKDSIGDYLNLCTNFESYITEYRQYWKVDKGEYLVFYRIDTTLHPAIIASLKIDKNLHIEAFTEGGKVTERDLKSLLNSSLVLEYWSQLKVLLEHFGKNTKVDISTAEYNLAQSLKHLKNCRDASSKESGDSGLKEKLEFIVGQMDALINKKYSPYTISIACSLYLKSSSCYNYLQNSRYLILPTERDLLRFITVSNMTTETDAPNAKVETA